MNKKITLCIGLPGAGKSTYLSTVSHEATIVSADQIKLDLKNYDPLNPHLVHEESVQAARQLILALIQDNHPNILLDGGGVNNKYNLSIIHAARGAGYSVEILYFDTPVTVCLERNRRRERKVPEKSIMTKALDIKRCLVEQSLAAGRFWKTIEWVPKYIFTDMDGVLVEYQTLLEIDGERTDYLKHNVFEYADPVSPMVDGLSKMPSELFLLTASPNLRATEQKLNWIKRHADKLKIEKGLIVGSSSMKQANLESYLEANDIDKTECMVIDDEHSILWNMNRAGIYAIHPSAFLALIGSLQANIRMISKLITVEESKTFLF